MREIKFRAWDGKKMWYKGFAVDAHGGTYWTGAYRMELWPFEEEVLMQYTGLKDKNGVEIYEGDVCRHEYGDVKQIFFGWGGEGEPADTVGDYYGWCFGNNDEFDECTGFFGEHLEVIGNIHENPELLNTP